MATATASLNKFTFNAIKYFWSSYYRDCISQYQIIAEKYFQIESKIRSLKADFQSSQDILNILGEATLYLDTNSIKSILDAKSLIEKIESLRMQLSAVHEKIESLQTDYKGIASSANADLRDEMQNLMDLVSNNTIIKTFIESAHKSFDLMAPSIEKASYLASGKIVGAVIAIMMELQRRKVFLSYYSKQIQEFNRKITKLRQEEQKRRDSFSAEFKNILPHEAVPCNLL